MTRNLIFAFIILLSQFASAQDSSLRILTENWPPITFEKYGQPSGMAVELAQLLQKRMNTNNAIEVVPWPRAYELVKTRPNILLFTVIRTPEREKLFTLLGPIANGEMALIARQSSPLDFRNMQYVKDNYSIGVHRGTAFQKTLEEQGFKRIVPVNSPVNSLKMLMAGRVDLICDDVLAIKELLVEAGYPGNAYKKVYSLLQSSLYFAFSKGTNPQLIQTWRSAFEEIKKNGEFKTLHQKWFGNHPPAMEVTMLTPPERFSFPERPAKESLSVGPLKFQFPDLE